MHPIKKPLLGTEISVHEWQSYAQRKFMAGDQDFLNKSDRKRNHLSMTSEILGNMHGSKVIVSQAIQLTIVVKPVDQL